MTDESTLDPARLAVAFGHVLRTHGPPVPVGRVLQFAAALGVVGLLRPEGVYWAGRATLMDRFEDIPAYDRAFACFFAGTAPPAPVPRRPAPVAPDLPAPAAGPDGPGAEDLGAAPVRAVRYSPVEHLRRKDVAAYTPADVDAARRLLTALRMDPPTRPARRRRPARTATGPDLRRTVRLALQTGGEPVVLAGRAPGVRARRLVLLCDISGSMEPYARAMLRFAHTAMRARPRVEVFALGTRLSRLTRPLGSRDPDAAIQAAAAAVPDWSGGTRLGEGVRRFNDDWGVRGVARGAVVVILSDGWDRGDPAILAEQMARLQRVAHRVVWVNPLKAAPGYEPLARGMAAALPFVDAFVEGHSIAALEHLASVIADHRR
jgi:uncharacterized protein with von Willebrand factor type A (vWA) domain